MKIIDIHPTHYVLGTDDGKLLHVARTPGVEAMMRAQHPGRHDLHDSKPRSAYADTRHRHDGLADGGIVEPVEPYDPQDPANQDDAPLKEFLSKHPEVGTYEDLTPEQRSSFKEDIAKMSPSAVRARAERPATAPEIAVGTEAMPLQFTTTPNSQPIAAPIPAPMVQTQAGAMTPTGALPMPAAPPPGTFPQEEPQVAPPAGTADRMPAPAPQVPPGPDLMGVYNADILHKGEDAANAQDEVTKVLQQRTKDIAAHGPAPSPTAVDPTQYYANIGRNLGFKSPQGQRIMGGIAAGLFSGLGEIGAALSHRENGAAKIIQSAIQENIAAQNQNNQLTRQQWLDQTMYMTDLTNAKTMELASVAKSQDIRDNAKLFVDQNNLAALQLANARNTLKPEQAIMVNKFTTALAGLESIQARMKDVAHGVSASLLNGPMETYFGSGDRRTIEMATEMAAVNMAVRQAMTPFATRIAGESGSPEETADIAKQVSEMALSVRDTQQRTEAKLAAIQRVIARNATLFRQAASGQDSSRAIGGNGLPPSTTPAP